MVSITLKNIKFRHYRPGDYDSIRNLINLVQPHLPWSKAYFEWHYLRNPAGKAKVWIAEYQGRIIGNFAAVPHHFKIRKQEGITWMTRDALTHPEFRRLGIMHELFAIGTEAICNEEFPVCYTFPNEYSHRCFLRRGWIEAFRIPLRTTTDFSEKFKNIKDGLDAVITVSLFQKEVDDLWNKSKNDFHYTISRTSSYLTWRYLNKPETKYFPFAEIKNRTLNGLLIMKYYDLNKTFRLAHICELFVTPGNETALKNLIAKALKFAIDMRVNKLTAWLPPGHPYEPVYDSAGLTLDQSIKRWFVVKTIPGITGADKPENWHLSMGDSDVY